MKRYTMWCHGTHGHGMLENPNGGDWCFASEADAVIKDLELRIAVALETCANYGDDVPDEAIAMIISALTMPIESLHEFIKNNPQYGETV